ncbi:MAG: hypothetical protein WC637_11685 [Victivallales bacterium]|jgi:hypothetical protein
MNGYFFRVNDADDFFYRIRVESAKQRMSMKEYIMDAVNDRLDEDKELSTGDSRITVINPDGKTKTYGTPSI